MWLWIQGDIFAVLREAFYGNRFAEVSVPFVKSLRGAVLELFKRDALVKDMLAESEDIQGYLSDFPGVGSNEIKH